jgi:hypothetical protein
MKAPVKTGDDGRWERTIARYLTANKIPIRWKGGMFQGIAQHTIRRIAPMRRGTDETLARMPAYFRQRRDEPNLIVLVTNRMYGDDIEDSLVVMRLGTLTPMFATFVNNDRERWIINATQH